MTKKDLLQKIDTWGVDHIAITGIKDCVKQFFESNVCIHKGENRLEYADEMHALAEGIPVEYLSDFGWTDAEYNHELRIKPSEPIYEWQWFEVYDGKVADYTTVWYTEEEMSDEKQWLKIEETKRIRQ